MSQEERGGGGQHQDPFCFLEAQRSSCGCVSTSSNKNNPEESAECSSIGKKDRCSATQGSESPGQFILDETSDHLDAMSDDPAGAGPAEGPSNIGTSIPRQLNDSEPTIERLSPRSSKKYRRTPQATSPSTNSQQMDCLMTELQKLHISALRSSGSGWDAAKIPKSSNNPTKPKDPSPCSEDPMENRLDEDQDEIDGPTDVEVEKGIKDSHRRLHQDKILERSDPRSLSSSLSEARSSPARITDEAGSSLSFGTSCSSNNDLSNNSRLLTTRFEPTITNDLVPSPNRNSHQQISNNPLHQLPIVNNNNNNNNNAFNNHRANLRNSHENNKRNNNPMPHHDPSSNQDIEDDDDDDHDDIHRVNSSPNNNNVTPTIIYAPAFRPGVVSHNEHILQPLHHGNNLNAKSPFDSIQMQGSINTMEKGKCQCHHHLPGHEQLMPHIQQQREAAHQHHHHHQQQQQQQQQQQHRQKFSQQQSQQQRNHQQSQHFRHHHYHHPHQHLNQQQQQQQQHQQQQEHQRSQCDRIESRKLRNGAGDDETAEMMETGLGSRQPPALPPRPPPRPNNRHYEQSAISAYDLGPSGEDAGCCKKYVILCCLCGGLSAVVGSLFLAVHVVLSSHTASLAHFETVPSYIPGTMLILMGLFTILLARRKHRYGFLMKMCGSVGVVCALVCVLVTVTTTVVHMSRLQGLRECIYTKLARSCTCYGASQRGSDQGVLFEETPHCEAVHGALYDCLRALFGVSVAGILACIFSCMLLYQLLSHEKKKMYWEQLQLRCRSLYGQGGSGAVGGPAGGSCGCCNDCGGASPWWAQTPGNLYTPNPDLAPFRRWRLPWTRSRGPAPTPDSNYGFHGQSRSTVAMRSSGSSSGEPGENMPGPYSVLADETQPGNGGAPYSLLNGSAGTTPYAACTSSVASYSLLENGAVPGLWGPPPPYSDPNSPARRPQLTEDRRPSALIRSTPPSLSTGPPVNVSTNRVVPTAKRSLENYDPGNCEEYRQQRGPARPSDNYENAEDVLSSSTEQEIELANLHQQHHHHHPPPPPHHHHHHHNHHHSQRQGDEQDPAKGRRSKKSLKGVENGGFQQENGNLLNKQSESELYFGDVSSCCGPESSFYDMAVDKEQQQQQQQQQQSGTIVDPSDSPIEYPTSIRPGKQRQPSKRSRLPLPLPLGQEATSVTSLTESYAALNVPASLGDDLSMRNSGSTTRGPFLAPDAQYEVIAQQQTRCYTYYNPKNPEHLHEMASLASLAYRNGPDLETQQQPAQPQSQQQIIDGTTIEYQNDSQSSILQNDPLPTEQKSPSPSLLSLPPTPLSHLPTNVGQRTANETMWQPTSDLQTNRPAPIVGDGVCPVNV